MITYISSKNADKYRILFDKASQALINNPPEGMELPEDFAISTLNEYFAYLEDLVKISDDIDISRFFVRLPLDEDFFEINANSRTISVPSASFGRYGVGVQGDELAEVVYFTIDRYFDSVDLASKDISIIIQWEVKDANKNTVAGISQHFGKDIETIPGKIIFGWPISSELTQAAGTVKFAVRFYQLGEGEGDNARKLIYSFSTLPAEVSVNASLDYDLINKAVKEIDHGKVITNRIKNIGIHDPSIPTPGEPVVTIPLFVLSPEGNELVKIVDLPADPQGAVKLAVGAKPADIGVLGYEWKKFGYDSDTGAYDSVYTTIPSATEFVEVPYTEALNADQEYYTVTLDGDKLVGSLISSDRLANIVVEDDHFEENGISIELYKKLSVASVKAVGEYSVDITARARTNYKTREMDKAERIRIPGPLKPEIALPEESDNINVTPDDNGIHAITDNGSITLKVNATPGELDLPAEEVGQNPQVTLSYNWKKVAEDGTISSVVAAEADMPVAVLPVAQLPYDDAWLENTEEDGVPGAKGIFNQEHINVIQNGNVITVYPDAELKFFMSTDENQQDSEHQWIALDIDSGEDHLEGVIWNDSYTFTSNDENELGVADGHILFWFKADEAPVTRKVNDTSLLFRVSMDAPSSATYNISNNEMTIVGLPEDGLDNSYFVEVSATRNKETTIEKSGIYRVTNTPKKPVLSYAGAPVDTTIHAIDKQDFRGNYRALSFDIDTVNPSDGIIYLWMHATIDDEADYDDYGQIKAQIDLDGALANILENTAHPGKRDTIVDNDVAEYDASGNIIFGNSTGSRIYQLTEADSGSYYCIVINELNNHKAASVGPFFRVS